MKYWNDGICMSRMNSKHPDKRCTRSVYKNSDFCRYHKRYGKYLNSVVSKKKTILKRLTKVLSKKPKKIKEAYIKFYKMLNSKYIHNLFYIYDSWDGISAEYIIKLDGDYWDINMLIKIITQQLNSCDMGNPFPKYPHNPFNRKPFTVKGLKHLNSRLTDDISRDLIIDIFLSYKGMRALYKDNLDTFNYESTRRIREYLSVFLRFKRINYKDSQDNYVGYWTKKNTPLSMFEQLYEEYEKICPRIYIGNIFTENPTIINMRKLMDAQPKEYF